MTYQEFAPGSFVPAAAGWRVAKLSLNDDCDYSGKYELEGLPGWMLYQDTWVSCQVENTYLLPHLDDEDSLLDTLPPGRLTLRKRWELRRWARRRAAFLNKQTAELAQSRLHTYPPGSPASFKQKA